MQSITGTYSMTPVEPIGMTVIVNTSAADAFRMFTENFGSWWPLSHHIGNADPATAVIEPRGGGHWFVAASMAVNVKGQGLVWNPPNQPNLRMANLSRLAV